MSTGPSSVPDRPAPLLPPRVPDHELLRRIGRGAYGEVWLARSATGAFRAVKIVQRRSFDHDRPFEREFEGILKFEPVSRRYDSQVDILHVGRADDCFYYVMELADDQATGGQIHPDAYAPRTLKSDLLFHGRLAFEECVRIGIALATALEHLHAAGLVHRDVKPSNIIFVNGVPKLADIGLVTGVDATRSYVGTEGFAAPEGPGTVQADLFSLGKVLYELATGKDRQEFPELPTQLRELPDREGLVELNAVIARACRHDPKDRYPSAAAMRADLELLQSGKSLARLHRTEARLRFVQRAGAVAAAIAAVVAAGWLWQSRQTEKVRTLAEEKARLAEENRERVVRMDIANAARLMESGELPDALLWLADALRLLTNRPAEEEIHRIRIKQVLDQTPKLIATVANTRPIDCAGWSPDGRRFAGVTFRTREGRRYRELQFRDASSGELMMTTELDTFPWLGRVRFSRDGKRVFLNSPSDQHRYVSEPYLHGVAAVVDGATGKKIYLHHGSNLVWTAFSPDDRWLALAKANHTIQVLGAKDGAPVTELTGHTARIRTLSFSHDGGLLASGADDGVRLWRMPSGETYGKPMQPAGSVRRVALSRDGGLLVTAAKPKNATNWVIQSWSLPSGQLAGEAIADGSEVFALFVAAGDRLFVGSKVADKDLVRVWNAAAVPWSLDAQLDHGAVRCWDAQANGDLFAIGTDGGLAYVHRFSTGSVQVLKVRHAGYTECAQISPDGERLLTTSDDGTCRVWARQRHGEAAALELPARLPDAKAETSRRRAMHPGPLEVVTADRVVRLIDPDRLQQEFEFAAAQRDAPLSLWHGTTGRFWTTAENTNRSTEPATLVLWRKEANGFHPTLLPHPKAVPFCSFTPGDENLLSFGRDWVVRIWRTRDGQLERTVGIPSSLAYPPLSLANNWFTPDGHSMLVLYDEGRKIQLYDLFKGELTGKPVSASLLMAGASALVALRLSPDGRFLAGMGDGQMCAVADLFTGELAFPPIKHGGELMWVEWSPSGKHLLTAGRSARVRLWDATTGEQFFAPLETGSGPARMARWSPDGRFIATRNDRGPVKVWDAATGELMTPAFPHDETVRWLCITHGNRLVTASHPNLLRAWDLIPTRLDSAVIADYAKLLAGRRINAGGALVPLKSGEVAALFNSLRAVAPGLFSQP